MGLMVLAQLSFDDLGTPLQDVTWCVVDLETTGASPRRGAQITEIGAVKVRGGEVIGEFNTLVNPGAPIPGFITVLTGITNEMVADAPRIDRALPDFLEFSQDCVLVAHNAPFDIGFLRAASQDLEIGWPRPQVVDTLTLARKVLQRDEVPNMKLATLAARFSQVVPDHRALTDARATVDVLHALFERLGSFDVTTFEDLGTFTAKVSSVRRRKRHLVDAVPSAPGVYLFRDKHDEVLYVGTSRNLRGRVRSYFNGSETRSRMDQMIALAERIETVACSTPLEAHVRELRLISAHRPAFNRRSKFPERANWVKLTNEPWPRLSAVRQVLNDDANYIGPFGSRRAAEALIEALNETHIVRECKQRLPLLPQATACMLAEIDKCLSPCDGSVSAEVYNQEVARLRHSLVTDPSALVAELTARMDALATAEHFEDAARIRDRIHSLVRAVARTQRLAALTSVPELVAASPAGSGWDVHVIRYGRLVAAGHRPASEPAGPWLDRLLATAETPALGFGPTPAAQVEETEAIERWLLTEGTELLAGSWVWPLASAARHLGAFTWDRTLATLDA